MTAEIQDASTSEPTQSRIVVGVDGSPTSIEALEWAVREAQLRRATLEVTHVTFVPEDVLELETLSKFSKRERSILDTAVAKAKSMAPDVRILSRAVDPPAAKTLVEISKDADLLVVGSRGLGPFKEFALGSVSHDCARHARCPLVIIGPRTSEMAPVSPPA
jgi:nucleotide-binding universal stress UspA family protein